MQNLEKRITALEAAIPSDPFRAVRMLAGESQQDCRQRHGIPPDAGNLVFIQRLIAEVPHAEH